MSEAPVISQVEIVEEWELRLTITTAGGRRYLGTTHDSEEEARGSYRNKQSIYGEVTGHLVKRVFKRTLLSEEIVAP